MKTKVSITFRAENIPGEADAILIPSSCGPDVAEVLAGTIYDKRKVSVYIKLDETDERVAKVFALLEQYGVEVDTSTSIEYSNEDLQNARLLWVWPSSFDDEVYAGLALGTEYDLTHACSHCGTGAKQISPLYVAHKYMAKIRKHRAIRSMDGDILVDGGLRKKLVDAGITGISFGDVRARHESGKWSMVARDQILIEHVLPPMHGEFRGQDEQNRCKVCRRGGRGGSPEKPYRAEDLIGMCDFNVSWEWFGEFWSENKEKKRHLRLSRPRILVTPKAMNIFREAGVKSLEWTPVGIEE